ncbi:MAG TPA: nicotinate-nucleotide adenylyltransferase [Solirubrobacteraceae bacterium]|nr:nicotinate-nucleotide adenylyltransferase [Solirubrobacteraceae bacterium]
MADVRSLGILGGTFNPPHLGHIAVALHAREELGLECVVLMPAGSPLHKPAAEDPGSACRLAMCRLAARTVEGLSACALEIERGGPSYTVDTLRSIHASHPNAELTFIVGADTAATLASWREPVALLGLARLAVASRDGADRDRVLDTVAGMNARVDFLTMDTIDVSSSGVRERASRAEPLEGLVPAPVAAYIAEHHLYSAASGAIG